MYKNTSFQNTKLSLTKKTSNQSSNHSPQKRNPQNQNIVQKKTTHQNNYVIKQTNQTIQINHIHQKSKTKVNCRACSGTGSFGENMHKRCNGLGYVLIDRDQYRACRNCNHQGIVESVGWFYNSNVLCGACHGLGLVKIKS